jgi:hypothetical protein
MGDVPVSPDGADGTEPDKVLPEEVDGKAGVDESLLLPALSVFIWVELEDTLTAIAAIIRS